MCIRDRRAGEGAIALSSAGRGEVFPPAQLNASCSDDILREHVRLVLQELNNPNDEVSVPKHARFITAEVMLRLHNLVVEARRHDACGGWSKQATLARAVGKFTGVVICKSDAEYIGNAQDSYLLGYSKALGKAVKALRSAKALLPSHFDDRVRELQDQVYQCKFGGVPRDVLISRKAWNPVLQAVPVRKIEDPRLLNLQLRQQMADLREAPAESRKLSRDLVRVAAALQKEQDARQQAERAALLEAEARAAAQESVEDVTRQLRREKRAAELERQTAQGKLAKLEGQLCAAHADVHRLLAVEAAARQRAEDAAAVEVEARAAAEAQAQEVALQWRRDKREAELERQRAAGKLATLQGQVCAAHADVHRLLAVEAAARQRAEEAAANEEVARQAAEADALEASKLLLRQKREAKRERERALGQLARLEGHLGKMHAEAALAKKNAQHSASQVAELMAQLQQVQSSSQQQLQHVLQLKAKMAKRTRDALARATTADSVATQLKAAKRKLFEMRKEVTVARMRLNLDVFDTFDSDVSDVSSEADDPEDKDYPECDSPRAQQAESALALQRLQSMPSWQPGRGAGHGKGAPKFD
ncbi:MAG: hypothetical protein EBZ36_14335 [Acidobacteria bacterium]|nr:hypothetical protein [Acidobacteriota bacterium]